MSTQTTPADDSDEIDISKLLSVIWQARSLVAACVAVAVLIGGYYGYRVATPLYPAQTTIALATEQQAVITDIDSIFAGGGADSTSMNTEFEVIRSRRLVGLLVDRLNLVEDPEFNTGLQAPSILGWILGQRASSFRNDEASRRRAIDQVISRLNMTAIRSSMAFNIAITTTDPEKSTLIVNTLAELYIEDQVRQKLEGAEQAIAFLSQRTTELAGNVEALEQEIARRSESTTVIGAEVLQARTIQLRELRDRMTELRLRIVDDEAILASLDSSAPIDTLLANLESTEDSRFPALVQRLRTGRIEEDDLRSDLNNLIAETRSASDRSQQQLDALEASEEDISAQIRQQSEELIDQQQLQRELDAARLLYQTFFTRLQEASVQQGLDTADARIISEAVPREASSPRRARILFLSAVLGFMGGVAAAFLRELRFSGFRTADELRQVTGKSVLGSIPRLAANTRLEMLDMMRRRPNSVYSEAVRNLRTSILMSNIDNEPQVILVTSAVPGEGKTTLSLSLARYLGSMEGKRALLLEADIRRKTIGKYITDDDVSPVSFVDLLLGRVDPEGFDLYNEALGIEVLAGSDAGSNAADLMASRRFGDLLDALRAEFDYIVIDSAPVLAVPDARVLAKQADAIAFAVHWSKTTRTQVRQGLEMLESVGAKVDGMVLTQVDHEKMKSYGYGGQYGYDGYASGYYSDT